MLDPKRNQGIDLFRLIGAFFIMMLHTDYGNLSMEIVEDLRLSARWAVPFFFMSSGYFLSKKIKDGSLDFKDIEKTLIVLINLMIISSLIYYIPANFPDPKQQLHIENLLTGTNFHLWFIGALIFAYLFFWYIHYIRQTKFLLLLSVGILCGAALTDSYDIFFQKDLTFSLFRFLIAIPFMYFGLLIAKQKFSKSFVIFCMVLLPFGFILQYLEAKMFWELFEYSRWKHQVLVGTLFFVLPLFLLVSRMEIKANVFSEFGRKYSLFIYLYHPMVFTIFFFFVKDDNIAAFSPIIGFFIVTGLAFLLDRLFNPIFAFLNGYVQKLKQEEKNNPEILSASRIQK